MNLLTIVHLLTRLASILKGVFVFFLSQWVATLLPPFMAVALTTVGVLCLVVLLRPAFLSVATQRSTPRDLGIFIMLMLAKGHPLTILASAALVAILGALHPSAFPILNVTLSGLAWLALDFIEDGIRSFLNRKEQD